MSRKIDKKKQTISLLIIVFFFRFKENLKNFSVKLVGQINVFNIIFMLLIIVN